MTSSEGLLPLGKRLKSARARSPSPSDRHPPPASPALPATRERAPDTQRASTMGRGKEAALAAAAELAAKNSAQADDAEAEDDPLNGACGRG